MKRTSLIALLVCVLGAGAFIWYQGENGILTTRVSGLSPNDHSFFSPREVGKFWDFFAMAHNRDDILREIPLARLKNTLTFQTTGTALTLNLATKKNEGLPTLDRITHWVKIYLVERRTHEAKQLWGDAHQIKMRFQSSQKELIQFQKEHRLFTSSVSYQEREDNLSTALASAKDKIKQLEQHFVILKALDRGDHFSLQHIDIDLPSAQKYRELEQQYESMRIRYKHKHPKMVQLRTDLLSLKKILFGALFQQKNVLRVQIGNLESSIKVLKSDILKSNPIREKLKALELKTRELQESYQGHMAEHAELSTQIAYEVAPVIRRGGVKPAARKVLVYFGGIYFIFLLGVGIYSKVDTRIYHPRHIVKAHPEMPLLAVTPKLSKTDHRVPLHSHHKPTSQYSKSVLLVRNRLLSQQKGTSKVLLVTSAGKGVGSVSLASNLSISLAQNQKRVLIIDGQLRQPRQHRFFRIPNRGLAEVLQGRLSLPEAIAKVEVPNLDVLASGTGLTLKALCSTEFEDLLQACKDKYDFIFVDASPMSTETDSILIAQRTDGVILTIPSGKVTQQALTWAKDELKRGGVRVVGVILKEVPSARVKDWNEITTPLATA